MPTTITLREANQGFSRCIREVEAGAEFIVTRDGWPVARIVPVDPVDRLSPERRAAYARLKASLATGWDITVDPLDRDALHER